MLSEGTMDLLRMFLVFCTVLSVWKSVAPPCLEQPLRGFPSQEGRVESLRWEMEIPTDQCGLSTQYPHLYSEYKIFPSYWPKRTSFKKRIMLNIKCDYIYNLSCLTSSIKFNEWNFKLPWKLDHFNEQAPASHTRSFLGTFKIVHLWSFLKSNPRLSGITPHAFITFRNS